jgi:hypothetical protein
MTAPTLEALRLACHDSGVPCASEPSGQSNLLFAHRAYCRKARLSGRLGTGPSPNLNAIVGGRGTGKSTLIKAIRYAVQLPPANKDALRAHNGIMDANSAKKKPK